MTDVCLILMSYHMHIFIDYSFSNHSLNEEFQSGISIWFQGFSPGANLVLALNLHMILVFYQGELSTILSFLATLNGFLFSTLFERISECTLRCLGNLPAT